MLFTEFFTASTISEPFAKLSQFHVHGIMSWCQWMGDKQLKNGIKHAVDTIRCVTSVLSCIPFTILIDAGVGEYCCAAVSYSL